MTKLEQILNRFPVATRQRDIAEWYRTIGFIEPADYQLANQAWDRLGFESRTLANAIRDIIRVEEIAEAEPYPNSDSMCYSISDGLLYVSNLNCDHPLWTVGENIDFRIVHDVLGHYPAWAAFDWDGEIRACLNHARHLSELAQRALFTECIAQVAYKCVYGEFGP